MADDSANEIHAIRREARREAERYVNGLFEEILVFVGILLGAIWLLEWLGWI